MITYNLNRLLSFSPFRFIYFIIMIVISKPNKITT